MAFNIEHYPNRRFDIFPFTPTVSVDLNKSVKKKLSDGEQLTNATALNILKQIKWESDILSFLTKPIVAIVLSNGVLGAGLCIPAAGIVLWLARIFVSVLGGGMLGFSIENSFRCLGKSLCIKGLFPQLSQAYSDQSQRANEYIRTLEGTDHENAVCVSLAISNKEMILLS